MDAHLKRLAAVSMDLTAAEEALDAAAHQTARDAVDRAAEGLDEVRAAWPDMNAAERTIVGQTAKPLRERLDAARGRLPKVSALGEVPQEERALHLVEDEAPEDDPDPPAAA